MGSRSRPLRLLLAALALAACAAAPAPEPRAQRSANLSHITGTSRPIQLFLKKNYLQITPDGQLNGTTDITSVYTVMQRATFTVGLLTIQGVATCLYVCMDACGFQYAHKDISDDCLFEENYEGNYNSYSRIRHGKKTYLALDVQGQPRRTQIPVERSLGNLSSYALIMPNGWSGSKLPNCPTRRHRGKLKRPPPPRHRNCQKHLQKLKALAKRKKNNKEDKKVKKNKKANRPKKKHRHAKGRRRHGNGTTTTTEVTWDESTMSTMSTTTDVEFFRSTTAREAVGRA